MIGFVPTAPERLVAFGLIGGGDRRSLSVLSTFAVAGVMLGIGTLVVVMAIMNGYRAEVLARVLGLQGHLRIEAAGRRIVPESSLLDTIRAAPGVIAVAPMIEAPLLAASPDRAAAVSLRAFAVEDLLGRPLFSQLGMAGQLKALDGNRIAIGTRLAERLGLVRGDLIHLISPEKRVTPFGSLPRQGRFEVAMIFDFGHHDVDLGIVFLPLRTAQAFLGVGDRVSAIEVMVDNPDAVESTHTALLRSLGLTGLSISNWRRQQGGFLATLDTQQAVLFLILALMVLVAAINIVSSLVMLVQGKRRAVAILRTMGLERGGVIRVFVFAGLVLGVSGTLLGVSGGALVAVYLDEIRAGLQLLTGINLFDPQIYALSRLPTRLEGGEVLRVALLGLGLSFLATLYPAWRAARLEPAELLRDD